jgi:predicted NAD/FAD-dependent oxidoreductase
VITRRRALGAGWLAAAGTGLGGIAGMASLAGCEPRPAPRYDGGFVGASPGRGHRLLDPATARQDTAPAPNPRRASVVIVGAGIAGLACARALRQAGIDDVHLLEFDDEAGGNSRGHAIAGMACPMGAHYLPVPGSEAIEVSDWLHEIGLLHTRFGRTEADERHLCHSPQERLFIDGVWHEGLLPEPQMLPGAESAQLAREYRRFADRVAAARREIGFALPADRAPWTPAHAALDAQTFAAWLDGQGLRHPALRWALDYACRDDYGAPAATVSAWAGLHYFASRHGFRPPGEGASGADVADDDREPVFTWPEGNAWLVRRLAEPLGERLHTGRLVERVDATGRGAVQVQAIDHRTERHETWLADQVVLCVPLFIARRLLQGPADVADAALTAASRALPSAPWLVAHLHLERPLADRLGAPPAWDNVIFGSATLGYVDAMHQGLRSVGGPTVLSAYWALGGSRAAAELGVQVPGGDLRAALRDEPWSIWAERVLRPLAAVHPDLPGKVTRIDIARHGHAMAMPVPGLRGHPALAALRRAGLADGRVHLAHADLAAYSVFEEAFTLGHQVGRRIVELERGRR